MSDQSMSLDDSAKISVSVVIVIFAVVALEKFFHLLHLLTKDSAFNKMILRIEKELMIVGSTAFIFKLISSSTSNWIDALDFADLLIPIFSFCYCAIGFTLIISSLNQSHLWSKAYYVQLVELLDEFRERSKLWVFKLSWKPLDPVIAKIEFRIFHSIFCDIFLLQSNAFAFDEYVARVYEKFVFSIVSISYALWMSVATLVLLNWARIALDLQYQSCDIEDDHCKTMNDIIIFSCAGGLLFVITTILVHESRNLEMRIMAKRGILSYHSYEPFLRNSENSNLSPNMASEVTITREASLRKLAREEVIVANTKRLAEENSFGMDKYVLFVNV